MFAEVILELSVQKRLDYAIPNELQPYIHVGSWVEVPLRNRTSRGYVASIKNTSSVTKALPIQKPLSEGPVLTDDLFQLALWMAEYYSAPLEKVLRNMLPAGVRRATKPRHQYFVSRAKTRGLLAEEYKILVSKAPMQAKVIEILLKTQKGMLLTQLAEAAGCSSQAITALVNKGLLTLTSVKTDQPIIYGETYFVTRPKTLREEQKNALNAILSSLENNTFSAKLLFGVTGSGKTEVYLQAITRALEMGKGVLMLVPEIALTAQTILRFKSRLSVPIAVLHHRLSDGERFERWNEIRQGKCRIVIGARSAVFSPIPNLGLIIVDEEHESSYKQTDDSPTYHARDVAIMRAKLCNACIVLGSATPALESYHNAQTKKYELLTLAKRCTDPPTVHVVDMARERDKGNFLFSDLLLKKIEERALKGEQIILLLNRRGYYTTCLCNRCQEVIKCKHCDNTLTFHKSQNLLSCHLCGCDVTPPRTCPYCHQETLIKFKGLGTEKVESALRAIFPTLRVLRTDADTTRHKGSLGQILHAFRTGKADIMVGTQMIAKGLHFPDVSLVGIINCDTGLNIPDFRSQESTFQLITQVSGRSGREYAQGEVVIQTNHPTHPIIQAASAQDYEAFYQEEIAIRKMFNFPPFCRIVKFTFQGTCEKTVAQTAHHFADLVQRILPNNFFCHPATPCAHTKVKDAFRYQCLVRGPSVKTITAATETLEKEKRFTSSVHRFVDIDPLSTI